MQDYYGILGVPSTASLQEIKRAYRQLARLYHPDLNKQAPGDQIKRLNEAYEVLRNLQKRAAYDAQLTQLRQQATRQAAEAALRRQQAQARREPEISWFEGVVGFVDELKKGLKEE